MITAYGDAETKQKALENGAEALLTKPIDFTMLRTEIDTQDRACRVIPTMSAIGTKRTSLVAPHMSAFGCKADMMFCTAHVCF